MRKLFGYVIAFSFLALAAIAMPPKASADGICIPSTATYNPNLPVYYPFCDASGNLRVVGTFTTTPSGTQNVNLIQVAGSAVALGQTTMAGSFPVVLASNQSAVPVSGTVTANAGTGVFGVNLTQVGGSAVALGQTTSAGSLPVTLASNGILSGTSAPGYMRIQDASGTNVANTNGFSDGESNGQVGLLNLAYGFGFNGTTWDRLRTTSATNTGVLATGTCDPTTAGQCMAVDSNNEGTVRVGKNGNYAAVLAGGGDAQTFGAMLETAGAGFLWNGSTYDRVYESGTLGAAALPYGSGATQTLVAKSFVGVLGSDGTNGQPIKTTTSGVTQAQVCNATGATCASIVGTALKVDNSAVTQPVSFSGSGATTTAAIASGAGTVVVKASAGRLYGILPTSGSLASASVTCYDNASTTSGTIIGGTPTLASGALYTLYSNVSGGIPYANGLTCSDPASAPGVTVLYQ